MPNQNDGKEKGLRGTLRDRNDDKARSELDEFTVLQDVDSGDLKAKAYETDQNTSGDEDIIAANPLLGINNQYVQNTSVREGLSREDKNVELIEAQTAKQSVIQDGDQGTSFNTFSSSQNVELRPINENTGGEGGSIRVNARQVDFVQIESPSFFDGSQGQADTIALIPDNRTVVNMEEEEVDVLKDASSEDNTGDDTSAEPLSPNLNVRVSHATDNQTSINSADGYDLVIYEYGTSYTVSGVEMGIAGVSDNAQITYIFHDENTVEVTLDTAWNSVKNIEVSSDINGNVTLNNFVHTDVNLGEGGDSSVIINGAKRGNIITEGGDDVVEVNAQTNNASWDNNFNIDTGAGADVIEVTGDKGITGFNIDAGADNVIIGGSYDGAEVTLGSGQDILFIRGGNGNINITDFGGVGGGSNGEADLMPHHDTIKLEGDGLTAENMLLNYDGQNTVITFDGVEDVVITLDNFDFTDLDNLPAVQGWNIIFDGQEEGTDAYDVFNDHGAGQNGLWNQNSVTHLNNADNNISGNDDSDDVINAMDGDDVISGGTGDDVLRGQEGNDTLIGQGGDDILAGGTGEDVAVFSGLHSEYNITFNDDGSMTIVDMVDGRDGRDILSEIESVEFRDGVFDATPEALILPCAEDGNVSDEIVDNTQKDDVSDDNEMQNGETIEETGDGDNGHGNDADGVDESNPGKGNGGPNAKKGNNPSGSDGDNGHGNDADGVDESNPGKGNGRPNAEKNDNQDENEFFELMYGESSSNSQNWLNVIEQDGDDEGGSGIETLAENDNWLAEVDTPTDEGKSNNGKNKGKDFEDYDADVGAAIDLVDIMPDVAEQNTDVTGVV